MKVIFAVTCLLASGAAVAQTAPERDARGIPVISDAPNVPPGVNQPLPVTLPPGAQIVVADQRAILTMRPADEDYPSCTRQRTDNCVQAYVGGRERR